MKTSLQHCDRWQNLYFCGPETKQEATAWIFETHLTILLSYILNLLSLANKYILFKIANSNRSQKWWMRTVNCTDRKNRSFCAVFLLTKQLLRSQNYCFWQQYFMTLKIFYIYILIFKFLHILLLFTVIKKSGMLINSFCITSKQTS